MIRPATEADVSLLPGIEVKAAERFRDAGLESIADRPPAPKDAYAPFLRNGGLVVAAAPDGQVVGFIAVGTVDGDGYIDEISVVPEFGNRGLGRRLIQAACEVAGTRRQQWLRLTTFRDIPWNAPWYRRLGFRDLEPTSVGPALGLILERQQDLHRLSPRVAMEYAL